MPGVFNSKPGVIALRAKYIQSLNSRFITADSPGLTLIQGSISLSC
jgi:hypothetical protein